MSHETYKTNRKEQFDPSESEIVVRFKYYAGYPGSHMEPPEPRQIEILKIEDKNGNDITDLLSEAEYEAIENELYEDWEDTSADDEADYRYEQYREEKDRE